MCSSTSTALAVALKPTLLIVEVQTGSSSSTGEDFVELYNPGEDPVDLTTIRLDYLATGATSQWTKKTTLVGNLASHDRYLISTKNYLVEIADAHLTSGMSKTGGSLRLTQVGQLGAADETLDLIGWGTAKEFMGDDALPGPDDGTSLKRRVDEDGAFVDTKDNVADFGKSSSPTPSSNSDSPVSEIDPIEDPAPIVPEDPSDETSSPDPVEESIASTGADADVWITELFADPASPQTDADDEFVELYNPGNTPIDLSGYVLQTGLTYSHSYIIASLELAAHQYQTLPAHETGLALSNSGSRARIVGPSGKVLYETAAYEKALEGQSFSLGDDAVWHWTTTVTPNEQNSFTVPAIKSQTSSKTTSQSKTSTKKTSSKAATPKTTSSKASKADTSSNSGNALATRSPHLSTRWLVGLGSLALLYAGWEYRDDLRAKIYKLRTNVGAGRKNRPEP